MNAKRTEISHAAVRDAIRRFQERGGLVKKLPAQPNPAPNLVGAKWAISEPVLVEFQTIAAGE